MDEVEAASSGAAPRPRRFAFVHNAELRPVLEQAWDDSRDALDRGQFGLALILSSGVIEAIITDALEHRGSWIADCGPDPAIQSAIRDPESAIRDESAIRNPQSAMTMTGRIADWSFDERVAAAEKAGLIRGGCARLPPLARRYRELTDVNGELRQDASVSERDARVTTQVLHVVMRDLDPGR